MAQCVDGYWSMDLQLLSAVIQLQLQDSEELSGSGKGKQREGTLSDAQLALMMYTEDLMSTNAILEDRRMAQSMAMAVIRDGQVLQRAHEQETQFDQDREIARNLQDSDESGFDAHCATKPQPPVETDPWTEDEMLAKAAALYMQEPGTTSSTPPALAYDSDCNHTAAEPSAWAAARRPNEPTKKGNCIACGETLDFYEVARVPCNHEYCRPCLAQLFELSITDESLFPPRCDNMEILLSQVRFFLPTDLARRFEAKYAELSTKNKVYCHDARCSQWIQPSAIDQGTNVATCPACRKTTCAMCKNVSHTGNCPDDTGLQQLLSTADAQQWQRCFECRRFVELETGCNHMTCRCGAQFCYICGARWKTCQCAQWDEPRLMHRAAQIVDRNPNRRLFEPARVPHAQPRSRRLSAVSRTAVVAAARGEAAPSVNLFEPATPAESAWQSDFSDRSEWEEDWPVDDIETEPAPLVDAVQPAPANMPVPLTPAPVTPAHLVRATDAAQRQREQRIAEAIEHLRENHECSHNKWRWVRGRHQCEECLHVLREYIFECKQCSLQACNRCRRNRL